MKHFVIAVTFMLVLVISVIYWNEARKEVIFLCGNFSEGVSEISVIKQLETGNLLRYRAEEIDSGRRIEVFSTLNFLADKCGIKIDSSGKVVVANLE